MATSASRYRTRGWRSFLTSDEVQTIAGLLDSASTICILAIGLYRVGLMTRSFVDPVFKSKARWSVTLLGMILLTNVVSLIPSSPNILISILEFLPFLALLITVYAFVDRTIVVAERMDFFHRDVLSWSRLRVPLYIVVVVVSLSFVGTSFYSTESLAPAWLVDTIDTSILLLVGILGYASVTLVVSARRSVDRTLRRHIQLLGVSLAMFVFTIALSAFTLTDAEVVLNDAISVASLVVLYFAVMSLTPLGKVGKDDNQA